MTKDEQIKMLKEQRAVLRASNEKFRKEFIDKACEIVRDSINEHFGDWEQSCKFEDKFRKAMTKED